jgi:hypothetical protein
MDKMQVTLEMPYSGDKPQLFIDAELYFYNNAPASQFFVWLEKK